MYVSLITPVYSLSGFVVGLLVGLTGVGGGSLMTPLLVLVFGIHPATAVGTDLLYAAATKATGTLIHGISDTVDWRVTGLLASGSIPAAAASILFLRAIGTPGPAAAHVISLTLGVALLATAASLIFRPQIVAFALRRPFALTPRQTAALTVLTGAILGTLVSLSSVGAGAIGVTVLLLLYPRRPMARIIGTDIAHAVPLTLLAGAGHWLLGSVDWPLLGSLLVGSVPGIILGSLLAIRVSDWFLRPVLAATLVLVGSKLLA